MDTSSAHHGSLDPTHLANFKNKLNVPSRDGMLGLLDASAGPAELVARREKAEVTPGKETEMLAYRAKRDGRAWLNPTFLAKTGAQFSVNLANELDEDTTIHWHGLHLHWQMDGHPLRRCARVIATATHTPWPTGEGRTGTTPTATATPPARSTWGSPGSLSSRTRTSAA